MVLPDNPPQHDARFHLAKNRSIWDSRTTKDVGKGTGLGLAMVHGFVESHHGLIEVESTPGKGAVFRIRLPASRAVVSKQSKPERPAAIGGSETLLVADDEPMVRAVATRILTEAGYHVLSAENGVQAVELFAEHQQQINLILLDVVMPKMTGRQAFDQIRKIKPSTPAIFCTGYDPETSQAISFQQDSLPLVQKPYEPDVLLSKIRSVLDATVTNEVFAGR